MDSVNKDSWWRRYVNVTSNIFVQGRSEAQTLILVCDAIHTFGSIWVVVGDGYLVVTF